MNVFALYRTERASLYISLLRRRIVGTTGSRGGVISGGGVGTRWRRARVERSVGEARGHELSSTALAASSSFSEARIEAWR